jgi:HEAT repeat protein
MSDDKPLPHNLAARAIGEIGTNGLPLLLRLTEAREVSPSSKVRNLLAHWGLIPRPRDPRLHSRWLGLCGFAALGASARPVVPALTILLTNLDAETRATAATALGYTGDAAAPAIPALIEQLKDTDESVRDCAMWALGELHQRPELVVPALAGYLQSPPSYGSPHRGDDRDSICNSLHALSRFGREATSAVPVIQQFADDRRWVVRWEASNSLQLLQPLPAARATPK